MNKKNNQNRQPQKEVKRREDREEKSYDDQVEGRNSVLELLESGKDINKIFIAKGERHGSINKIIAIAKEKGIILVEKDKRQMDEMAQNQNYQGVIAIVPPFEYCEIEDILEEANKRNEDAFVLILDGIDDWVEVGYYHNNYMTIEIVAEPLTIVNDKNQYYLANIESGGIEIWRYKNNINMRFSIFIWICWG